jgi:hypothetical protein
VFYPLLGILNPLQCPGLNLTPAADPRYRFDIFPKRRWSGTSEALQELITGPARGKRIEGRRLQGVLAEATKTYWPEIEAWKTRMEVSAETLVRERATVFSDASVAA